MVVAPASLQPEVTVAKRKRTFENHDGEMQTVESFVEYLQTTLIPDLRESGRDATADDFDDCIQIIEDLEDDLESYEE